MSDQKPSASSGKSSFAALRAAMHKNRQAVDAGAPSVYEATGAVRGYVMPELSPLVVDPALSEDDDSQLTQIEPAMAAAPLPEDSFPEDDDSQLIKIEPAKATAALPEDSFPEDDDTELSPLPERAYSSANAPSDGFAKNDFVADDFPETSPLPEGAYSLPNGSSGGFTKKASAADSYKSDSYLKAIPLSMKIAPPPYDSLEDDGFPADSPLAPKAASPTGSPLLERKAPEAVPTPAGESTPSPEAAPAAGTIPSWEPASSSKVAHATEATPTAETAPTIIEETPPERPLSSAELELLLFEAEQADAAVARTSAAKARKKRGKKEQKSSRRQLFAREEAAFDDASPEGNESFPETAAPTSDLTDTGDMSSWQTKSDGKNKSGTMEGASEAVSYAGVGTSEATTGIAAVGMAGAAASAETALAEAAGAAALAAGAETRKNASKKKRPPKKKAELSETIGKQKDLLKKYADTVFDDQPDEEDIAAAERAESVMDLLQQKEKKERKKSDFFARLGQPKTPQPTIDPATVERNDSLEGLNDAEVELRTKAAMVNYTAKKGVRTTGQIIFAHTVTYFNILNIILGVLIFLTGQYKNMLFLGVIVCNSVIGIAQELKVKSLISKLSVITAARVTALRNGEKTVITTDKIVLDDVIFLSTGDQIVTDGRVFACRGLEVNESMLTGESKPVKKKDGDEVLSGSFIVAGTAIMKVDKVGDDCYATQLVSKAQTKKRASSEMQVTIGRIIKVVSVAIIPIGLLLFRSQYAANGGDFAGTVVRTVSGIIGMIPEGLVLLTSVSFIIGVGRLAQKKALVQEMEAIEALARTNILCTDKTGTITTGDLKVHKILPFGSNTAEQIRTILGHVNGAFDDTNATQEAMNRAFGTYDDWPVREIIPFSSARKYRAVSFAGRGDYCIGAPEFLMPGHTKLRALVEKYSEEGYRVLLLGRSSGISAANDSHGVITPVALIIISDVIKEDAKEIFNYFADAGVEVKVLSGDNPVTVSTVAMRAGVRGAENYVDATTLPENPQQLAREITKYSVFGRVKPEQKQAFVKAWQMSGRTVAMVGDGVNDVLAIKDADCGIAMAAGSEAAKQAAHIVLMDSDFSSMKDIVKEGRTIISNIERVSSLYLTKTIYSCVLCLIFILLQTKYPFTTLQMGLINVCGIGMPSFLLTLEQQENVHSEGFLKHILAVCLPAAMTFVSTMMIVQVLNAIFQWPTDIYSTFNLMLGGVVAMLVVADVCWPLNAYRRFVLVTCIVCFIAGMLLFPGFYDMHSIFMWWTLLLIPLCFLVAMMLFWFSRITNRFMVKVLKSQEGKKPLF